VLGSLAKGYVLLRRGEDERAIEAMERGMALCDQWTMRVWELRLKSSLAVGYARAGVLEKALQLGREALDAAGKMNLIVDRAMLMVRLGQVLLLCGYPGEALEHGRSALEIARAQQARGDEAWARFLIGRACWVTNADASAEAHRQFEETLALAEPGGSRPLAAFCRTMLGAIEKRRGNEHAAAELAALADRTYEQLGMRPLAIDPLPAVSAK
jgi:tetratricopeptide (TPR) repeat protein